MPRFSVSVDRAPVDETELLARTGAALKDSPVNGSWRDGAFAAYDDVRIAVLLPGPVAPVFHGDLATLRARDPESFTAPELAGATFTVVLATEVDSIEPLLVPRQAGVLGVGRSRLTLACDARAVSPADAAALLAEVGRPVGVPGDARG